MQTNFSRKNDGLYSAKTDMARIQRERNLEIMRILLLIWVNISPLTASPDADQLMALEIDETYSIDGGNYRVLKT